MAPPILAPAAVLVLWSMLVVFWIMFTRFPAFKQAGVDLATTPPGGRYQDLESAMPAKVNWVSHNYSHLMEQPTLFYAVIMILAVAGDGSTPSLVLAWAYEVTPEGIVKDTAGSPIRRPSRRSRRGGMVRDTTLNR